MARMWESSSAALCRRFKGSIIAPRGRDHRGKTCSSFRLVEFCVAGFSRLFPRQRWLASYLTVIGDGSENRGLGGSQHGADSEERDKSAPFFIDVVGGGDSDHFSPRGVDERGPW